VRILSAIFGNSFVQNSKKLPGRQGLHEFLGWQFIDKPLPILNGIIEFYIRNDE
jgi:hypothetical protein